MNEYAAIIHATFTPVDADVADKMAIAYGEAIEILQRAGFVILDTSELSRAHRAIYHAKQGKEG